MRFLLFLSCCLFLPLPTEASCPVQELPVVDRYEFWDFRENPRMDFYLPTRNSDGGYLTWAAAHMQWNGKIQLKVDHELPPEFQFSLPYSVQRVEIDVGVGENRFHFDQDLTVNCSGAGRSVFPGQSFKLWPIKVPARTDGKPREIEPVRVRIWGIHS